MLTRTPIAIVAFAASLALAACSGTTPRVVALDAARATGVGQLAAPAPNLVTAGQPTREQLAALAQLGIARVVCLRPATEPGTGWEEAAAKELGIEFVRLPIANAADVTPANAKRLAEARRAADGVPTLVCCKSSNRVGALLALERFHVDGAPAADALAFGKAAGLVNLEPRVVEQLK